MQGSGPAGVQGCKGLGDAGCDYPTPVCPCSAHSCCLARCRSVAERDSGLAGHGTLGFGSRLLCRAGCGNRLGLHKKKGPASHRQMFSPAAKSPCCCRLLLRPHPRQHPSCPPRWENDILGCFQPLVPQEKLARGWERQAGRQPAPAHRAFPRRAPEKTPKPGVVLPAVPLELGRGFTRLGLSFYCRGPGGVGQQGPCKGGRQVGSLGALHPCSTTLGCRLNVFSFLSRSPALLGKPLPGCRQLRLKPLLVPLNSGQHKPALLPKTCRRGLLLPFPAATFPLPAPGPGSIPTIPSLRRRKAFFPPCACPSLQTHGHGGPRGIGCWREPSRLARSRSPGSTGQSPGAGTPPSPPAAPLPR